MGFSGESVSFEVFPLSFGAFFSLDSFLSMLRPLFREGRSVLPCRCCWFLKLGRIFRLILAIFSPVSVDFFRKTDIQGMEYLFDSPPSRMNAPDTIDDGTTDQKRPHVIDGMGNLVGNDMRNCLTGMRPSGRLHL